MHQMQQNAEKKNHCIKLGLNLNFHSLSSVSSFLYKYIHFTLA